MGYTRYWAVPLVHHKWGRWTTTTALADYLGIHRRTMERWVHDGLVPAVVPLPHYTDDRPRRTKRRVWRVYEDDLVDFLKRLRGRPVRLPAGLLRSG